ncbi:MAG: tRNA (guanosine(46)-N7)-methyltransferase TrmB [Epsilonproteobacteria bacterium]|nr:tRNA (guanosine(46)-N7)-methyltransferase TrmB [Campylobacterota bacterium]
MPHIVAKNFHWFDFPARCKEFRFLWYASPLKSASDWLVAVEYGSERFLLRIKPKEDRFIIKSDKITRPSPTFLTKEALRCFCDLAECEILHHNLSSIKPSHAIKAQDYFKDIRFFEDFPKREKISIEIGFGSGRHLLYQAQADPDTLFIGIEIHKPSIEQLLKQIALRGLKNIYVVDYDARLFLELVPSNAIEKIFVHFPVPWDKKPHRRVISSQFIQEACRVLKPGGILELRTDSRNYFDYSLDLFLRRPKVDLEVQKNIPPPVASKYEERWLRLGKDIYDIRMRALEHSEARELERDFSFRDLKFDEKFIQNFDNRPRVFDGFFVHPQRLYRMDEKRVVVEISFGSFDRPEHRFIVIEESGAFYFPKDPVATRTNLAAHKKIEEIFHE